jgi:hypothetical protein
LVRLLQHKEPGLFLLRDLHPHVGAPGVVRLLRDLARVAGGRRQLVVLLGPVPLQPTELAKDLVTIDLPLPDADEVQRLLSQLLKHQDRPLAPEQAARFVRGALGLTEEEIKRLFARVLLGGGRFGDEDLRTLIEEKRRIIRHSRYLELWEGGLGVGDVGGMDNLSRWLDSFERARFAPEARAFGLPDAPRGLLLLGVQGCGKSLAAQGGRASSGRCRCCASTWRRSSAAARWSRARACARRSRSPSRWRRRCSGSTRSRRDSRGTAAAARPVRHLPHLDAREAEAGLRGGHRQRRAPPAARAAAKGPL